MAEAGVDFPLIHASAEAVPLPDASFDIVFCDHGAMTFADPYRTIPEAARLLRAGGHLRVQPPFADRDHPLGARRGDGRREAGHRLFRDAPLQRRRGVVPSSSHTASGIRLFRTNGFIVEDLIEPRPPEGATSSYRKPDEIRVGAALAGRGRIWRLRRERLTGGPGPPSTSRTRSTAGSAPRLQREAYVVEAELIGDRTASRS